MKNYKMTMQQAQELVQKYENVFSVARILKGETIVEASMGASQNLSMEPCRCFESIERKKEKDKAGISTE